jgi:four helix bundle protein
LKLEHASSFRELIVYRKAREVARDVFRVSQRFPREETFALTDQIRRSSRAVGAQIAEGWAKRRYPSHFTSKLTDADAEQQETQHWVEVAQDCGYIDAETARSLNRGLGEIGRMLHSMMDKADLFCGTSTPRIREETAEYLVHDPSDH